MKITAPQYVKPFVRRQKNDSNDAEAICTAVHQRNMRFVPKKSLEQQDIQALHRARQRLVNHRTALISQMRGLLLDRGIAIAVSAARARRLIPNILSESNDELTEMMREIVSSLYALMLKIDERIKAFDRKITAIGWCANLNDWRWSAVRLKSLSATMEPNSLIVRCCAGRREG